eukprot:6175068-Pleurochrysis_carterae.AAC.1
MERAIYKRDNIEAKGRVASQKKGAAPTQAALAKEVSPHAHANAHTRKRTHAQTHTRANAHTHTRIHAQMHTHRNVHADGRSRARTSAQADERGEEHDGRRPHARRTGRLRATT